jgi:hypothetical protein
MGYNLVYILLVLIIIIFLLCIIFYNRKTETFNIPTKNLATENKYQGLDYPASDSSNSISSIFNNFVSSLNNPPSPSIKNTISTNPTTTKSLQTVGNTPETVIPYLKEQLDIISKTYFNQGIKPAVEIDNWINNLQERLNNVQLKMIELNITPNEELVFY